MEFQQTEYKRALTCRVDTASPIQRAQFLFKLGVQ
jgi:hypothetical protein